MTQDWRRLAEMQHGLLSQRQLNELGVTRSTVRNHLRARRWSQRTSSVFSVTTGPLSWEQELWRAVLHAGPHSIIGGLTAAKVHGLKNWDRAEITVYVANALSFEDLPGVRVFRTRRAVADMRAPTQLPLCSVAPATLLFAGYEPNRRTAHGAVAAVVQQRLVGVPDLAACCYGYVRFPDPRAFARCSMTSVVVRTRWPRSTCGERVGDSASFCP